MTTYPVPNPDVDVVLPCLDEAGALPWVLSRIPPGWRALVVDNGSTDGSAELARELGATVVREERRGFGAACHAGLTAATADIVCFCDCDGSLDPGLLRPFVAEVLAGEADLVLGRRRPLERGAWPPHARAGNVALARMLRRRTGLRLHDLGPLRAARREALLGLGLTDRRSGYPLQMVVRAADAGWRVTEHDVPYLPRTGVSKVTGTWRGTWQAVRDMSQVLAEPPVPAPGTAAARSTGVPSQAPSGAEAPGRTPVPASATAPPPAPARVSASAPASPRGGSVQ
ncbi:glycosyltransferase family 2 protein [Streptomyces sp. NPDC060235]|uniref:glycosyltransferase family 2 protein n=1 Tax=unclassified Streptomyces TaxID=2593676 RepID=UPI0033348430